MANPGLVLKARFDWRDQYRGVRGRFLGKNDPVIKALWDLRMEVALERIKAATPVYTIEGDAGSTGGRHAPGWTREQWQAITINDYETYFINPTPQAWWLRHGTRSHPINPRVAKVLRFYSHGSTVFAGHAQAEREMHAQPNQILNATIAAQRLIGQEFLSDFARRVGDAFGAA